MAEEVQDERVDPTTFFSPEIQHAVTGMVYLGGHSDKVRFCGHTFGLETIRPHMKFALAQAMEPYRNTLMEPQVWAAMHVGMSLTSIDGRSDFCPPIGDDPVEFARARLEYITGPTGWWQPTIDYLFGKYVEMENVVTQAVAELHSLSLAGKATSSPSPGFSNEPELSTDETGTDFQHWARSSSNS